MKPLRKSSLVAWGQSAGRAYSRAGTSIFLLPNCFATPLTLQSVNHSPENDLPNRRNPATGVHIHLGESTIVLLTITTDKRTPWLATETAHRFLCQTWSEATAWLVGDYVLMSDHFHAFCAPSESSFTIETWISYWKRAFSLKHGRADWKFQSRGWHHRLRNGENYSAKWLYVQENPLRNGLRTGLTKAGSLI